MTPEPWSAKLYTRNIRFYRDEPVPFYCEEKGSRQAERIVGHLQLRGAVEWIVDEHDGRVTIWVRNKNFDLVREVAEPNVPDAS